MNQLFDIEENKVYPISYLTSIVDNKTGKNLEDILKSLGSYFIPFFKNKEETRKLIPKALRNKGLQVTFLDDKNRINREYYNSNYIDDDNFSKDSKWIKTDFRVGNNISISSDGFWVLDGKQTTISAQGIEGITPELRINNNFLEKTYDGWETVEIISDPIITYFRYSDGFIQATTDKKTWINISEHFQVSPFVKGYFEEMESLEKAFPHPEKGNIAWVGKPYPGKVAVENQGQWLSTDEVPSVPNINMDSYVRKDDFIFLTEDEYDSLPIKNPKFTYVIFEE